MRRVAILQKYLSPYRVPLFNAIASHPDIKLVLIYYGKSEARRKWSGFSGRNFFERHARRLSIQVSYEKNIDIPLSLYADIRKFHPHLIVCAPDMAGVIACLYSKFNTGCRFIIWSEATPDTEKNSSFFKVFLRKKIYEKAKRFIVPGFKAERYVSSFLPDSEFSYMRNTIEEERFRISENDVIRKFRGDRLIFTFSGSIIERKGIHLLLKAFNRLIKERPSLKERCTLRILGTGPIDVTAYGNENVRMEGFCSGERYVNFLKKSHIFILPSLWDCNPLTVIEGLFSGNLLIVSSGVGNYPEIIHDNGFVIQVGPQFEDDLIKVFLRIIELPRRELLNMALNSLRLTSEFSAKRNAEAFISSVMN